MATYTERAWNISDADEIARITAYIARLKEELVRLRQQDPVEFWWDEMARYQKALNTLYAIPKRKRTDEQEARIELYTQRLEDAIFRFRLAREPKRTWVDITGDVVWGQTNFTQAARTGPGSFTITLKGAHEFRAGEEIHLDIDDLRVFGGWVTSVERGYFFEDAIAPKTILHGTDYNILFDRLVVRNYPAEYAAHAETMSMGGKYTNWPAYARGTLDSVIIDSVFATYVLPDLPIGFDYQNHVDAITTPAPVAPWVMPEAGSSLRRFMQSISQITSGVWYIDATMALHYHDRDEVTAPYPITDGVIEGISARGVSVTSDISSMANDVFVWGTLAKTIEGDIVLWHEEGDLGFWERYWIRMINTVQRYINNLLAVPAAKRTTYQKQSLVKYQKRLIDYKGRLEDVRARSWDPNSGDPRPDNAIVNSIDTWGRWQYGEFRQDIHHPEWLNMRAHSILTRFDEPIVRAKATVYEPGFQAGHVVRLFSSVHGVDADLVIRQMNITFAVAKEPDGDIYYAVPRYDLEMGLDPEAPWQIYDYLPYPGESTPGLGTDNTGG